MTKEKYEPTEDELEERFGLTEAEYDAIEGDSIHEKVANFVRMIMSPKGNVKERRTNMRTLKTISVILPMTLLLACGGGGGGYSSAPAPSIQPELILDETSLVSAKVYEGVNEELDDVDVATYAAVASSVVYQYKSFDDWNQNVVKLVGPNGELIIDNNIDKDLYVYHVRRFDDTFKNAVYTGDTYAERANGDFEQGTVTIKLKVKNDELTKMKFHFSGTDYDWKKNLKFGRNATHFGPEYGTYNHGINSKGQRKGIIARFHEQGNLITGRFGNKKLDIKDGVFGATKDTVEIK